MHQSLIDFEAKYKYCSELNITFQLIQHSITCQSPPTHQTSTNQLLKNEPFLLVRPKWKKISLVQSLTRQQQTGLNSATEDIFTLTRCQNRILTENIWFVWSKTSYSGDKRRCHYAGRTTNERTNEQVKIELLSRWKLEAEFRKNLCTINS